MASTSDQFTFQPEEGGAEVGRAKQGGAEEGGAEEGGVYMDCHAFSYRNGGNRSLPSWDKEDQGSPALLLLPVLHRPSSSPAHLLVGNTTY